MGRMGGSTTGGIEGRYIGEPTGLRSNHFRLLEDFKRIPSDRVQHRGCFWASNVGRCAPSGATTPGTSPDQQRDWMSIAPIEQTHELSGWRHDCDHGA